MHRIVRYVVIEFSCYHSLEYLDGGMDLQGWGRGQVELVPLGKVGREPSSPPTESQQGGSCKGGNQ